jgi:hypothetical protein
MDFFLSLGFDQILIIDHFFDQILNNDQFFDQILNNDQFFDQILNIFLIKILINFYPKFQ